MLFVCDPWASYVRQLEEDAEREYVAWEAQLDLEHEEQLGREHVLDMEDDIQDESDWPWYAELPYVIEEPEVIDGWEV